jgi:hypothetical protein
MLIAMANLLVVGVPARFTLATEAHVDRQGLAFSSQSGGRGQVGNCCVCAPGTSTVGGAGARAARGISRPQLCAIR